MTSLNKHELLLTTSEFEFTNNQVAFVKAFIHRKYPAAMSGIIDKVRGLMKFINAASSKKMQYGAYYYTGENSTRYHVYENLLHFENEDLKTYLAIEPVDQADRSIYRQNAIDQKDDNAKQAIDVIDGFLKSPNQKLLLSCQVQLSSVLTQLLEIIKSHSTELVIHACELTESNPARFILYFGHKETQSHFIKVHFDLLPQ